MRAISKHIAIVFSLLLAVTLFHSCSENENTGTPGQGEARLALTFNTGELALTRAVTKVAGVEEYNENLLHKLDVFFYPLAGTGENQEEKTAVLHLSFSNLNTQDKYEITDYIVSKGTLNTLGLKNDGAQCYVYVVANSPVTFDDDKATISNIKAQGIEASNFSSIDNRKQDDFVMTGEGKATFALAETKLSGDIPLKRVAAKMEFRVTEVKDTIIDDGGNVWVSDIANMRLQLNDGVKATNIGGTQTVVDADYFKTSGYITLAQENGVSTTSYYHDFPFYSYPSNWDTGTDREAYATLVVPWARVMKDDDGKPKIDENGNYVLAGQHLSTYYQIPIANNAKGIFSNAYYKMNIKVGIIGSFDPTEPVVLKDNSYIIVDWSQGTILPIAMKKINYLAVASNEVTISNKETGEVAYVSSQDITATVKKVTFWDYTYNYEGDKSDANSDVPYKVQLDEQTTSYTYPHRTNTEVQLSDFTLDTTTKPGYLMLKHSLGSSDYVPYTVEVEVSNGTLTETVTFKQYPPIYIEGNESTIELFVNGGQKSYDNWNYDADNCWQHVEDRDDVDGSYKNNNRYLYTIHISSLSENSYSIGDVRDEQATQTLYSGLSGYVKYRPTKESDEVKTTITPAFLIASSYGKTWSTSFDNEKKRCASYQEDGYPAGRWRVPTEAEIKFVIDLSQNSIIPKLFDGDYFASSGRYYSSNSKKFDKNSDTHSVRCVYDLWYWGTEHNATTYTWGDK